MITLTSKMFTKFVLEHNLKEFSCTVRIDPINLSTNFIFTDDISFFQLKELTLDRVYFDRDQEAVFSFIVPDNIQIFSLSDTIKLTYHNSTNMATLEMEHPAINITIPCHNMSKDNLHRYDVTYYPMSQFKNTLNSIKQLKGLASDLSIVSDLEFNGKFWSVSIAQCCLFGMGEGIDGSLPSQLFEKIYDYHASVAMIEKVINEKTGQRQTILQMVRDFEGGDYIIETQIRQSREKFPDLIPGMVAKCSRKVCDCIITNDVSMIVRELLKTVKKDAITVTFSDHRFDLEYNNIKVNMRTNTDVIRGNKISVKIPIKMLNSIASMLSEELEILTNGDLICIMKDNRGMILTGLTS